MGRSPANFGIACTETNHTPSADKPPEHNPFFAYPTPLFLDFVRWSTNRLCSGYEITDPGAVCFRQLAAHQGHDCVSAGAQFHIRRTRK